VYTYATQNNVPLIETGKKRGEDAVTFGTTGSRTAELSDKWDGLFQEFSQTFLPEFRNSKGSSAAKAVCADSHGCLHHRQAAESVVPGVQAPC